MEQLYSSWSGKSNEEDDNGDNRLLKRLRMVLLFWLVSFIVTIIWFTNSPAF